MSRRKAGLSPSLFPFLAVLVCTLGTLILLLALVAQEAKDAAVAHAQQVTQSKSVPTSSPEQPEDRPELTLEAATQLIEEEQFRMQQLVSFRDAQTQDAETKRNEVAVLEAAIRELKTRLERLRDEIETATTGLAPDQAMKVDNTTLVMMQEEIAKLRADIQELESNERGKKPRVVIVPHRGPNGTQRRPIYVECTEDEIRIMPEGARITKTQALAAAESENPNANPLGSALRVARRHAMQAYGDQVAPYPLLIVRPGGIRMFHIASALMKDWDDQYGYELVPGEVDLAFPGGDQVLRKDLEYAIHEASSRNFMFARGAGGGGRGGAGSNGGYDEGYDGLPTTRPSTSGADGFGGDVASGRVTSGGQATPGGNPIDQAEPVKPLPVLSAKNLDQQALANGFTPARDQRFANAFGIPPSASGGGFGSDGKLNSQSEALNDFLQGRTSGDLDGGSDSSEASTKGGDESESEAMTQENASDPDGSSVGQTATANGRIAGGTQSSPGGNQPMPQQLASNSQTDASTPANASAPTNASPPAGSPGGEASSQPPPPTDPTDPTDQADPANPTAKMNSSSSQNQVRREGREWAMPEAFRGMGGTEVVRPISMICHHDRYELLEQGRVVATFPFHRGDVYQSTIQLATAVRDRVAGWGATLPGGRWQPRLDVQVGPHAEQRFHELETLMKGSGVEINRRTP